MGLGLDATNDVSLGMLSIIRKADKLYLECYTSIINCSVVELEHAIGQKVVLADRHLLENTNAIIEEAQEMLVVLLVPGTPLFATTHTDLLMRCIERSTEYVVVNNTSIYNVVGHLGLFSYSFGRVVSIPFFTETFHPTSVFDKIEHNMASNLHTLCLLDIKIGKDYYEEPKPAEYGRFMTANTAMQLLLQYGHAHNPALFHEQTRIFVVCRFGCPDQSLHYGTIGDLCDADFGGPLHSLVIPSKMEVVEEEHVKMLFHKPSIAMPNK